MAVQTTEQIIAEVATAVAQAVVDAQLKTGKVIEQNHGGLMWNETPGKVRPTLKRKTVFCNSVQSERQLSDTEIELFNQLSPGRYHNRQWEVIVREEGNDSWMEIRIPVSTIEQRMDLPNSLVAILKEMIDEAKARRKEA